MIHIETVGNRTHTYSDTYKIRQLETGVIYDDAMDTISHQYEETDIPKDPPFVTEEEDMRNALSVLNISNETNMYNEEGD